jgi:general secretion pathway protein D
MSGYAARIAFSLACVGLFLGACASNAIKESQTLAKEGKPEAALTVLRDAMQREPYNVQLRNAYVRQLELMGNQWLTAADVARTSKRYDDAKSLYLQMQSVDPSNVRARDGLAAIEAGKRQDRLVSQASEMISRGQLAEAEAALRLVLAEDPQNQSARTALLSIREQQLKADAPAAALKSSLSSPITLEFRDASLRSVFDVISRTAGLNFVFDRDVRADAKVTIFVRNSPIEDVIRLVLVTNQLERKVLNENSLLIYPNTPAKSREYQELVVRSFYLANADPKQAQALVRTVSRSQNVYVDEKLNVITVRDTPEAVKLVERLILSIDIAEPEVMLDVEVLEVSRNKLQEIGINYPTEVLLQAELPTPANVPPGSIGLNPWGPVIWTIANPALRINLLSQDSDVSILANPRIRAKNREKAKILIGEKLPVFTSTAVPNAGVASSVSYIDVGLKLEVQPNVFLDNEVGILVALEVSNTLEKVRGQDGTTAYRIGTRSAQTNLRVRDGETQVLGGLINRSEKATLSKLPGLGDLPGIGRLFGSNGLTRDNSELVLLITPHIVRNLRPGALETAAFPSGTEAAAGVRPTVIRPTASRSISISGSGGRSAAGAPGGSAQAAEDASGVATAPTPGPILVSISVPPQAPLGTDFPIALQAAVPEGVVSGEAVLGYNASQLLVSGGENGQVVVRLSGGGGTLTGSASARVLSTGMGSTDVAIIQGRVQISENESRPLGAATASVRLGP